METARSDRRRTSSSDSASRSGSSRQKRSSSSNRRPLQGRDTGYRVGSARRQRNSRGINPKLIIVGVVALLLVIALVFGISSCVRSCSSTSNTKKKQDETQEVKVNPNDSRVAYGVAADETSKLANVLDRNEAFAKIAKNADKISDARLIDLAIAEPEAVEFVAGSIKNDGSTQPYGDATVTGDFPKLYIFDARWGYASYADGIVGSVGSGPVTLSMAYMGLTGKSTYDPSTVAQAVSSANLANGTTGMDDAFLTNHASDAGLSATSVEVSSEGIYTPLAENHPVAIKLKSDSGVGSPLAHWALITQINTDNSVSINDPTSATATSYPWSLGALCSRTDAAYSLSAAEGTSGVTPGTVADQMSDQADQTDTEDGSN